ncbi:MAG: hypothetical protein P8X68_13430 [Desulfobacterales bacterium]|jgi:acyl-coenzyme A synthetase/AMP-(fatty) acid ligase
MVAVVGSPDEIRIETAKACVVLKTVVLADAELEGTVKKLITKARK